MLLKSCERGGTVQQFRSLHTRHLKAALRTTLKHGFARLKKKTAKAILRFEVHIAYTRSEDHAGSLGQIGLVVYGHWMAEGVPASAIYTDSVVAV